LPDKPSIAVLPFENLSGDREQEYFADGMVEEIITALSRFRGLFVIARNSSFAYKGRAIDVRQIGRELGVRYILEGSIRKAGSKVRITGQLIDTSSGAHLWADRFDAPLEDIFDLQDQVTASVVGAIAPKLEQAEIERSRRKPTENLDAYDHYLRGLAGVHQWTKEGTQEALSNFYRAIELDPNFAVAYGMAARTYALRKGGGWASDREAEITETARLASKAAELGKDDAIALGAACNEDPHRPLAGVPFPQSRRAKRRRSGIISNLRPRAAAPRHSEAAHEGRQVTPGLLCTKVPRADRRHGSDAHL
jgi:TolB-like protein